MGKKRRIVFAILALAILGVLAWVVLSPRAAPEPVYQGKPLSVWLEFFDPDNIYRSPEQMDLTRNAIRTMGTNALPMMLQMLRTPDLDWKNRLVELAKKHHLVKTNFVEPQRLYARAGSAFETLGPRAGGAVPELVKIFDQNPAAQLAIARAFAYIGPDSKAAVPSLLGGAVSTNDILRNYSLFALGQIHAEPNVVVPVLIKALPDTVLMNRVYAITSLGDFGTNAKAAVPALVKFIESEEPPAQAKIESIPIKQIALRSLQQIDPDTAAKLYTNLNRDAK